MDEISQPIAYLCGILFTTFVVLLVFTGKMDNNSQSYVNDAVEEFVDDSCTTGYIAPEKYMKMVKRINNTGNLYNVTILCNSKATSPYVDPEDDTEKADAYANSYSTYNKSEVLDYMFPDDTTTYNNYNMKNGDYLKVSVSLKQPTYSARLLAYITKDPVKTISYSYGSYVGNYEENAAVAQN